MKTITRVTGKFLLAVMFLAPMFFQSCVVVEDDYGFDGRDGNAWASIDYFDIKPDYVNTNGLMPSGFYYGDKYRVYPGDYWIDFKYEWIDGDARIVDSYESVVEIWINYGEPGGRGYDGADGADVYFDIMLYAEGLVDVEYTTFLKSGKIAEPIIDEKQAGNYSMRVTQKLKKRTITKDGKTQVVEFD